MEGSTETIQDTREDLFICYLFRSVVLNRGWFCPSGHFWQCLETLLVVTLGKGEGCSGHLVGRGQGNCWAFYIAQQGIIWSKLSIVLRLRSPGLNEETEKEERGGNSLTRHSTGPGWEPWPCASPSCCVSCSARPSIVLAHADVRQTLCVKRPRKL